jgi:hypothetical protein
MRDAFLRHVWTMIDYWDREKRADTTREKMEGLAFSILVAIDGGAGDLPGHALVPLPHKEDKAFCKSEGENWYPYTNRDAKALQHDIGGGLHEHFHNLDPKKKK